mgnify:FL=1
MWGRLRRAVRALKRDVMTLYLAVLDPRTPWYAKALAACVVAYALSPIDLIPDFVPVLGYLDDLILVPLGVLLVLKLIPAGLLAEFRAKAASAPKTRRIGRIGGGAILILWLLAAALCVRWALGALAD